MSNNYKGNLMKDETKPQTNVSAKLFKNQRKNKKSYFGISVDDIMKVAMFIALTCTIAFNPIIMKMTFKTKGGSSREKYAPTTVHSMSFVLSLVIANIVSFFLYGLNGWKDCFNFWTILIISPVSIGYSISEALAMFGLSYCDPLWYAVIHKIRLPLTQIATKLIFGRKRKITPLQWIQSCVIVCLVLGFVFVKVGKEHAGKKNDTVLGIFLLLLNITVSVICSTYADWAYKKVATPLTVQIACGRISACIASFIISFIFLSVKGWLKPYGFFGGPKGGWDGYVILLCFWNVIRDWITCCNLLYLTAIWKALSAILALVVQFTFEILFRSLHPSIAEYLAIIGIFFAVIGYTFITRKENENRVLKRSETELKNQLAVYQMTQDVETP